MADMPDRSTVPTLVRLGPDVLRDPKAALRREWIVTNGLGGYASGTSTNVPTRAYHGYLIAALHPPVDRTVLVSGLEERAGSTRLEAAGLESLELEGLLPVWRWRAGEAAVERRVWMEHGRSTTYVRYEAVRGRTELEIAPLVTSRDHQEVDRPAEEPALEPLSDGLRVRFLAGPAVTIRATGGTFEPDGAWSGPIPLPEQAARGEGDAADAYRVGRLRLALEPGSPVTVVLSTEREADVDLDGEAALARARARQEGLIERADGQGASGVVRQLVLAADQFLVERRIPRGAGEEPERGRTVIAGYH